jgi:polysaccharide export outer membrane protein
MIFKAARTGQRLARRSRAGLAMAGAMLLAACASSAPVAPSVDLPAPSSASIAQQLDMEYRIGALDLLTINVFQVPDLTLESVQVDAAGTLSLPLVGVVQAGGRTTQELSQDIARRLETKFLQDPQVSVQIKEASSQKVTVEGAVIQPGVYDVSGPTTLLQAIALARGPDRVADVHRVAIFRTIEGKRAAAVFDLTSIRSGTTPDPRIYGNDIVVVQGSRQKGFWQEVLRAVPAIGLFRFF